jgi:son of sevenless-like protein
VSAIQNAAIYRLKNTREGLPKKFQKVFQEMIDLMSPKANYKLYRQELSGCSLPYLPYIGVFLTDMTFVEDGNVTYFDDKNLIVNFEKQALIYRLISEIQQVQSVKYSYPVNKSIQEWILESLNYGLKDEEIYKLSLICESRKE